MIAYVGPALFALFVWWASTVAIIYLDNLPRPTFKWSMLGATVVFAVALYGLAASSRDTSTAGAYWAFTWGLLAWGWQEMSFYMGFVTGSRKQPCREDCGGFGHFVHAVQTSLYHELAIIGAAIAVVWLTSGGANQVGTWTFMVLWWMHQSAKLNVFFGVRNLNEEFLPEHLEFLKSFLRKRSMNLLFPVSVTVSTVITVLVAKAALADGATVAERAGYTFLTVLMALAILEHWMLVLPMPAGAIWSPGLKSRGEKKPFEVEIVVGFLGAGKTTFLQRKLKEADPALKTVVLVNDFGALGLDGALLEGRGADVVELSNGCICCSLRSDLAAQLKQVVAEMKPDRVLIEPSGVADVASLLRALHTPEIAPLIKARRLYTVIDAGAFLADYVRMPDYFDVQTRLAPVFILNKTDLVSAGELAMVAETLRSQNPDALVVPARYGIPVEKTDLDRSAPVAAPAAESEDAIDWPKPREEVALGLESWSAPLLGDLDLDRLHAALAALAGGAHGQVMRVKGIATAGKGWVKFDLAGGRATVAAHVPQGDEAPRALAIGLGLDRAGIADAFLACTPGADRDAARVATAAALDRAFGSANGRSARAGLHPLGCGCTDHAPGMSCDGVPAIAAE